METVSWTNSLYTYLLIGKQLTQWSPLTQRLDWESTMIDNYVFITEIGTVANS